MTVRQKATNATTITSATTSVTTAENVKPEKTSSAPNVAEVKIVDDSNETEAKLTKNCLIAPLSQSLIWIKTTFASSTDVLFDAARDEDSYNQGILWANSVAWVSEEGKILVTAINVTEKEVYFVRLHNVGQREYWEEAAE